MLAHAIMQMDTPLLAVRLNELLCLAQKFGSVGAVVEHLRSTLTSMQEAWEDALVLMDTKLADYSSVECISCNVVLCILKRVFFFLSFNPDVAQGEVCE